MSKCKIFIADLEVHYRVGVTDEERQNPQKLLLTIEMKHDFTEAAKTDDLTKTIDYYAVCQELLKFGENRSWKLLEKLSRDIAERLMQEFGPESVEVFIKKFIIPEAKFVGVKYSLKD